ncbi:MAG: AI-2E family transporter [Planctomycetota bacterium]
MSDPTPPPQRGMGHPVVVGGVAVIAFVALTHLLRELQVFLVPFVLAVFLTYSLSPLLDYLVRRLRWPGFLAIPATFLIALLVLAVAGTVLSASAVEMAQNSGNYTRQITRLVDRVENALPGWVIDWAENQAGDRTATDFSGVDSPTPADGVARQAPSSVDQPSTDDLPAELAAGVLQEVGDSGGAGNGSASSAESNRHGALANTLADVLTQNVGPMLQGIAATTRDIVSSGLIVLIFMFFMMLGRVEAVRRSGGLLADIEGGVKGYIILKTIISAVTGLAQGTALYLFGVEYAIVFGLLGFLFNFIPNIGPFLATLAPVPIVLLALPEPVTAVSIWWAIFALGIPGAIHFTSGVLETRFMGTRFDVHPVVVMLGLMYFSLVWGIIGAFLSTPILAVIRILCSKSDTFRPVALALAGKLDEITDGPADDADGQSTT